ncbi:MAG: hypothetical protein BAA04_01595 [Firmicutes bacterium ZCTH02-B6]|nr:MAG: hypothetical protein BAA04_01595 [Firmicutes bacterium ZCTH02-B6]
MASGRRRWRIPAWRWTVLAVSLVLWAGWGWQRWTSAAIPAYGPVAHHVMALHQAFALHLALGALLLAAWAVGAARGRREKGAPGTPATARSGGIGSTRAETRVHASRR